MGYIKGFFQIELHPARFNPNCDSFSRDLESQGMSVDSFSTEGLRNCESESGMCASSLISTGANDQRIAIFNKTIT